jgi:hypothetical protein
MDVNGLSDSRLGHLVPEGPPAFDVSGISSQALRDHRLAIRLREIKTL